MPVKTHTTITCDGCGIELTEELTEIEVNQVVVSRLWGLYGCTIEVEESERLAIYKIFHIDSNFELGKVKVKGLGINDYALDICISEIPQTLYHYSIVFYDLIKKINNIEYDIELRINEKRFLLQWRDHINKPIGDEQKSEGSQDG